MEQTDKEGLPFSLKFVTADRKRKTGGDLIELHGCKLKGMDVKHATRNILLSSGKIRKVHIRLIIEYNGHTIVY